MRVEGERAKAEAEAREQGKRRREFGSPRPLFF